MGRQVHFHMLGEDLREFFRFVQDDPQVTITARDSSTAQVLPLGDRAADSENTLCLWNKKFLPRIERKWISEPGYYRVDSLRLPVLEFMPPFKATWEGKPALGQGRLFGNFEAYLGKPADFEKWYEVLASWIRKRYRKGPLGPGDYVGPEAYEFYRSGGFLLPNTLPPRTREWIAEIDKQHAKPAI
jgi:hypothetical protein